MAHEVEDKVLREICEVLISNGLSGASEVLEKLLNEAMKIERSEFLRAKPYERTEEREGYANGYKPKTLLTRTGEMRVEIPQVRGLKFYPRSLERGCRSERALKLAIAEMWVKGVSTRKVSKITEVLCGTEISSSQVSRLSRELDEQLQAFRERPLGEYPYVYLDARYEKIRHGGRVISMAVLMAIGVNGEGYREVLGVSALLSEAEVHWRRFLESLAARGLHGVKLIISDDHSGLKEARQAVFPSVPWQRCQYHLSANAQKYAPSRELKAEIGQVMRDIFQSPDIDSARTRVKETIEAYEQTAPQFVEWLEENVEEGFTVYEFPRSHQRRIRTTNSMERLSKEVKRRTRVATLFPNEASCLRLVSAVLCEIHEEWLTGKLYLNMELLNRKREENRIYRKNVA